MRCPSCGTENEADSRFCGHCGGRMGGTIEPRVAPTIKITGDNAVQAGPTAVARPSGGQQQVSLFPQPAGPSGVLPRTISQPPGSGPIPPGPLPRTLSAPPEMPGPVFAPGSAPGSAGEVRTVNQRASTPAPRTSTPAPQQASLSQVPTNVVPPRSLSVPPNQAVRAATPPPGSLSAAGGRSATPIPRPSQSAQPPQQSQQQQQQQQQPGKPVVRTSTSSLRGDSHGAPAVGGRSWPLIVLLLIIDIGLAGSGAFMLIRGLADPPAVTTVPTPSQPKAP